MASPMLPLTENLVQNPTVMRAAVEQVEIPYGQLWLPDDLEVSGRQLSGVSVWAAKVENMLKLVWREVMAM
jgi:hypothetical protein